MGLWDALFQYPYSHYNKYYIIYNLQWYNYTVIIISWKEQDVYIDSILTQLENSSAEEVTR